MHCPKCGKNNTRINNVGKGKFSTYRRYKCLECGYVFFSEEFIAKQQDNAKQLLNKARTLQANKR